MVVKVTNIPAQADRLEKIIIALNLTKIEVAKRLGVSRSYISMITTGNKPISQKVINAITTRFPMVNTHWLLTGIGNMFFDKNLPAGTLDPQVMEGSPVYGVGKEGVLEGLVRRVSELEAEMEVLRAALAALEEEVAALRAGGGGKE